MLKFDIWWFFLILNRHSKFHANISKRIGTLLKRLLNEFRVYWNVPSEACHKYGLNFSHLESYGIIQNKGDTFKGDKIVILYDPGLFPAIIDGKYRNGGVPQEGNISLHLKLFQKSLIESIPDKHFSGIGIIDFEHWRPIFRENWAKLDIYRTTSKEIEKKKHPFWNNSLIQKEAIRRFEKSAFKFMDETLQTAKKERPKAKWGYYIFPFCFNLTPKNMNMHCTSEVKKDNERSIWMYKTGTALYPSVYLQQKTLNENKRAKLIQGRMTEGLRIANKGSPPLTVIPYTWYKYQDTREFLSKADMTSSIMVPKKSGVSGVIIWGSSKDVDSSKKCSQLDAYTRDVLRSILKSAQIVRHSKKWNF